MEQDLEYIKVTGGNDGEVNPNGPLDEAPDLAEEDIQGVEDVWVYKDTNNRSLGLVLNSELEVTHVICRGASDGKLRRGDRLLSVDGKELAELTQEQLAFVLNKPGQLHFKVRRRTENGQSVSQQQRQQQFIRAPYEYNPHDDPLHPCKMAGLTFQRGDIIEVLSEDSDWWQGILVNGECTDVGLFPSPEFQIKNSPNFCARNPGRLVDFERQGVLQPLPDRPRPLVLLGAPGVVRYELLLRLIQLAPERFASPVAHTTRPPREGELDGVHYWFCSKHKFKHKSKFLETWKSGGYSYGFKIKSVESIVDSGRVCVLPLQPRGLELLRAHKSLLRPFSIFFRPPAEDAWTSLWQNSAFCQRDQPQLSEIHSIARQSERMEFEFGDLFDEFVDLTDYQTLLTDMVELADQLSREPQWVPLKWLPENQRMT